MRVYVLILCLQSPITTNIALFHNAVLLLIFQGNEIIQRLQSELRTYKSKVRTLTSVDNSVLSSLCWLKPVKDIKFSQRIEVNLQD